MVQAGREVGSWTDYILGIDLCLLWNISVRDPRHNSDHYLVLGCLHSAHLREHSEYLGRRKRLPLRPPTNPTREDGLFTDLWRSVPNPKARDARKNAWIPEDTGILVDKRLSIRQDMERDQLLTCRLGRAIAANLKGYKRRRTEEAGEEVEKILGSDPPLHRESCHRMKGWYRYAVNHAPLPLPVTLERITSERVDIYSYVPPPAENIPVSVEPFRVDGSAPTEDKIKWTVTRLRNHRSGGPSGNRVKHLKGWLLDLPKKEREEVKTYQETIT